MKNITSSKAAAALGSVKSEAKSAAARTNGAKSAWKFKVVKKMRGHNGEWFGFPAAATFAALEDATTYAREFAAEQRAAGVASARITVLTRGNSNVFEARVNVSTSAEPNGEYTWSA